DLSQTIFCIDVRSPGKEFERYYEGAKAQGGSGSCGPARTPSTPDPATAGSACAKPPRTAAR
ncbi:MAG: hypothetical protein WAK57_01905, partial [Desulfobacterales bacterium]